MSERSGVEIDYCPTCRGVWLDRGELDRIIERFEGRPGRSYDRSDGSRREGEPQHRFVEHRYGDRRRTKKKGVLAELFDFD
jgi:Zn-finger nucleic acid-binding protein